MKNHKSNRSAAPRPYVSTAAAALVVASAAAASLPLVEAQLSLETGEMRVGFPITYPTSAPSGEGSDAVLSGSVAFPVEGNPRAFSEDFLQCAEGKNAAVTIGSLLLSGGGANNKQKGNAKGKEETKQTDVGSIEVTIRKNANVGEDKDAAASCGVAASGTFKHCVIASAKAPAGGGATPLLRQVLLNCEDTAAKHSASALFAFEADEGLVGASTAAASPLPPLPPMAAALIGPQCVSTHLAITAAANEKEAMASSPAFATFRLDASVPSAEAVAAGLAPTIKTFSLPSLLSAGDNVGLYLVPIEPNAAQKREEAAKTHEEAPASIRRRLLGDSNEEEKGDDSDGDGDDANEKEADDGLEPPPKLSKPQQPTRRSAVAAPVASVAAPILTTAAAKAEGGGDANDDKEEANGKEGQSPPNKLSSPPAPSRVVGMADPANGPTRGGGSQTTAAAAKGENEEEEKKENAGKSSGGGAFVTTQAHAEPVGMTAAPRASVAATAAAEDNHNATAAEGDDNVTTTAAAEAEQVSAPPKASIAEPSKIASAAPAATAPSPHSSTASPTSGAAPPVGPIALYFCPNVASHAAVAAATEAEAATREAPIGCEVVSAREAGATNGASGADGTLLLRALLKKPAVIAKGFFAVRRAEIVAAARSHLRSAAAAAGGKVESADASSSSAVTFGLSYTAEASEATRGSCAGAVTFTVRDGSAAEEEEGRVAITGIALAEGFPLPHIALPIAGTNTTSNSSSSFANITVTVPFTVSATGGGGPAAAAVLQNHSKIVATIVGGPSSCAAVASVLNTNVSSTASSLTATATVEVSLAATPYRSCGPDSVLRVGVAAITATATSADGANNANEQPFSAVSYVSLVNAVAPSGGTGSGAVAPTRPAVSNATVATAAPSELPNVTNASATVAATAEVDEEEKPATKAPATTKAQKGEKGDDDDEDGGNYWDDWEGEDGEEWGDDWGDGYGDYEVPTTTAVKGGGGGAKESNSNGKSTAATTKPAKHTTSTTTATKKSTTAKPTTAPTTTTGKTYTNNYSSEGYEQTGIASAFSSLMKLIFLAVPIACLVYYRRELPELLARLRGYAGLDGDGREGGGVGGGIGIGGGAASRRAHRRGSASESAAIQIDRDAYESSEEDAEDRQSIPMKMMRASASPTMPHSSGNASNGIDFASFNAPTEGAAPTGVKKPIGGGGGGADRGDRAPLSGLFAIGAKKKQSENLFGDVAAPTTAPTATNAARVGLAGSPQPQPTAADAGWDDDDDDDFFGGGGATSGGESKASKKASNPTSVASTSLSPAGTRASSAVAGLGLGGIGGGAARPTAVGKFSAKKNDAVTAPSAVATVQKPSFGTAKGGADGGGAGAEKMMGSTTSSGGGGGMRLGLGGSRVGGLGIGAGSRTSSAVIKPSLGAKGGSAAVSRPETPPAQPPAAGSGAAPKSSNDAWGDDDDLFD